MQQDRQRKIKIAWISGNLAGGGAERFTVTMVNALSVDKDYEIVLLTGEKRKNEYKLNGNVHRECIMTEKKYLKDVLTIRRYLVEKHIDIAVGIGVYANLCLTMANFRIKTQIIISERNAPKQDNLSYKTKILRWLLYRNADKYVFQTQQAQKYYSKKIQQKSVVIHNPVRADISLKTDKNNKEIVAIGRLMPQKNYPMLLRAFAEVHKQNPDYILRIFGTGQLLDTLREQTKELGLVDCVYFEGFQQDVNNQIKDSDIYVMSSDFEGMPNALMEAMAMGFPVVCTDCPAGGPAELIEDGVNGILIPVNDAQALSQKIVYLINHEQEKEIIAKRAEMIRVTHSADKIVEQWKRILTNGKQN